MAEGEEWKAIPGYEGLYEASSEGRVRTLNPRARKRRDASPEGVIYSWVNKGGYKVVALYKDGQRKTPRVNQLVARAFHGEPPGGLEVRHLNDVKLDNRASNLSWGSRSENMRDRVANGIHHQANQENCVW